MENGRALIIDDDKDTADLFRTILSLVGFDCEAVYSAKSALVYLAANDPDIVLLDMRLGLELDGSDILYQIRSNPRFDKTRVIVITAYPGMLGKVENIADLVLLKPVEVEGLKTLATRITQIRPKTSLFRDPVTNLYNINFFVTRLEHAYERTKRSPGYLFAVMAIQLVVDPVGGELLGDEENELILLRVASVLTKRYRPTDTFSHHGGLRVVALYEELKKPEDINVIIQRLHEDLTLELELRGVTRHITPVIGAVLNDPRFQEAEIILKTATDALDRASRLEGEYYVVADPFSSPI